MTRYQFEEQVLRLIGKNDPQFKVDGREILALANQSALSYLKELKRNGLEIPTSFYVPYTKTIVKGFATIPLAVIGKDAIESVIKSDEIIPIVSNEAEARIFDVIGHEPSCWVVEGGVKFRNVLDGEATIKAIPNLLEIEDEDLMYGDDVQYEIINRIFAMLQIKLETKEDRENNG